MNPTELSKTEFKAHALEVLRNIENTGTPLIITDHGNPTLEIRKLRNTNNSPLETLKGSVTFYAEPTSPVADEDWENA